MAFQEIPWPVSPAWEQVIELDEVVYTLSARFVECPLAPPDIGADAGYWVLNVSDVSGAPLEVGLKVVGGTAYARRSALATLPQGLLVMSSYGDEGLPDVPSYEDMTTGRVVLFYDSTLPA